MRGALTHCSTWTQVHQEIERSSQVLTNNGFSNNEIQRVTKKIIDKWYQNNNEQQQEQEIIKVYYRSVFSSAHEDDESIIKKIFKKNIKAVNPTTRVQLVIYYKTKKTSQLLLRNSPHQEQDALQRSHIIYRYTCNRGNCAALPSTYVGMTTMKLADRLKSHKYAGAPKNHMRQEHHDNITKEDLEGNTEVLASCNDKKRLQILEALYIKELKPSLNVQALDLQALPSMRRDATSQNPSANENSAPA